MCSADNVYGVLPKNGALTASVIIMLIHQIVAYALCESPFCPLSKTAAGLPVLGFVQKMSSSLLACLPSSLSCEPCTEKVPLWEHLLQSNCLELVSLPDRRGLGRLPDKLVVEGSLQHLTLSVC